MTLDPTVRARLVVHLLMKPVLTGEDRLLLVVLLPEPLSFVARIRRANFAALRAARARNLSITPRSLP
jgi:hypothetical protein